MKNNNRNNSNSSNNNNNNNNNNNRKRRNSDRQGPFNRRQRNNQDHQRRENRNRRDQPVNGVQAAQQDAIGQVAEEQQALLNNQPEIAPENLKKCTLCNKIITEMGTALKHANTDEYIHFDCAVKDIREKEKPYPNERICYLGKGSFGIIKFLSYSSSPIKFLIKKRIQYEGTE